MMKKLSVFFFVANILSINPVQANNLVIADTIEAVSGGTNFDTWKFHFLATGSFTVDVLAYEATQKNVATAGYSAVDVNGDGELTWLDADTQWWRDDGVLDSTDAIIRCDDVQNNCPKYASTSALTSSTAPAGVTLPISLTSHTTSETSQDGSVQARDPWYDASVSESGDYLFLIGAYYLHYSEVVTTQVNTQSFSPPTGFSNPITDHGDYQVTFSSDNLIFSRSGNDITVTAVPAPAAIWLFASAVAGLFASRARKQQF